jgi:hypothetical protein
MRLFCFLLPALLVAQTGDKSRSDALIAEFARIYSAIDSAYREGRLEEVTAYLTSDATARQGAQSTPIRDGLSRMRQLAASGSVFSSRSAVISVLVNDDQATVEFESEFSISSPTGTQTAKGTSQDTWVHSFDGWRLRLSAQLSQQSTVPVTDSETTKQVAADLN